MAKTGAELLVEALVDASVKYLFSLSGNQIMSIYDATIGRDIELIHTRHEAAAVHMADGWGRLTEQPGVALLTAGPGHANGLSALYVALMAESPLVALSGHAPLTQLGQGAFQEMDQVGLARLVTKAAWLVERPEQVVEAIVAALDLARSGRPGPVHLSLPDDVLKAGVATGPDSSGPLDKTAANKESEATADLLLASTDPALLPVDEAQIEAALDHLAPAQRPLILAGPALARPLRWQEVARLADITGIPALPVDSPRGLNDPALHLAVNLFERADVVLLLGKKLDFSLRFGRPPFFGETCRFIQIDAEMEQLQPVGERIVLTIHSEPAQAIQQLAAAARKRQWPARSNNWRAEVMAAQETVPEDWNRLRRSSLEPIHPLRVCEAVQPFLDQGAMFISDGGEFGQWIQAGLKSRIRLINGPAGAIGSAIPLGLAAKLARHQEPVFVLLGDGTFGFHAMEFDTALRYNLPFVAIVGNDARWNAEHQIQIKSYGPERTVGCELLPTRYDQVVAALGGYGELVERADELEPALKRAIESGLPACINVMIEGAGAPALLLGRG